MTGEISTALARRVRIEALVLAAEEESEVELALATGFLAGAALALGMTTEELVDACGGAL